MNIQFVQILRWKRKGLPTSLALKNAVIGEMIGRDNLGVGFFISERLSKRDLQARQVSDIPPVEPGSMKTHENGEQPGQQEKAKSGQILEEHKKKDRNKGPVKGKNSEESSMS